MSPRSPRAGRDLQPSSAIGTSIRLKKKGRVEGEGGILEAVTSVQERGVDGVAAAGSIGRRPHITFAMADLSSLPFPLSLLFLFFLNIEEPLVLGD